MSSDLSKSTIGSNPVAATSDAVVEVACQEMIQGWRSGASPLVEKILQRHPSLVGDRDALMELIACERASRVQRGESPTLEEYEGRFPELAESLRDHFALDDLLDSLPEPSEEDLAQISSTISMTLTEGVPRGDFPTEHALGVGNWRSGDWTPPPGLVIEAEIGHGGMGIVYRARQLSLRRTVALKRLEWGREDDGRFLTEAEAVARLQHPNVVQIYDSGNHDGRPYLVMEHVSGGSLATRHDGTPWVARDVAKLVLPLSRGMAEVHRLGIIHRDLKPSNILVTDDGIPKIADFGLAKFLDQDSDLTRTGTLLGSPSYMAPEQTQGATATVGPAADVHAFGAILYELLTGRPPYRGTTVFETLEQVRSAEPVPPGRLVRGVPRDIEIITLKCLQKDPARRYPTAAELADDLERFLDGVPILARPVGPVERTVRWARRHQSVAWLLATLAVVVVGAISALAVLWAKAEGSARTARSMALVAQSKGQMAERAAAAELAASTTAQRQAAILALERGRDFANQGIFGRGSLWMADSFRMAPESDQALRQSAAANVAAWLGSAPVLRRYREDIVSNMPGARIDQHLIVSPDGKTGLIETDEGLAALFDVETMTRRPGTLQAADLNSAEFSRDGRRVLITGFNECITRVFDVETGGLLHQIKPAVNCSFAKFVDNDRKILTIGVYSGHLELWDAQTGRSTGTIWNQGADIRGDVVVGPDTRTIFVPDHNGIRVWDISSVPRLVAKLPCQPITLGQLIMNPDQRSFAAHLQDDASGRSAICAWRSAPPFTKLFELTSRERRGAMAWRDDGKALAVGSQEGTIRVLDAETGSLLSPIMRHEAGVTALAFSPDRQYLLSLHTDGTVRTWLVQAGRSAGAAIELPDRISFAHWHAEGSSIVVGDQAGRLSIWDLSGTTAPARRLPATEVASQSELSADGSRIVIAERGASLARVLDVATGMPVCPPLYHEKIRSARFSPDGRRVATVGDDAAARVWDVEKGTVALPPLPHGGWVLDSRFTPDGKVLITVGSDGYARCFDLGTGRLIGQPIKNQRGEIHHLAILGDDLAVFSGPRFGTLAFHPKSAEVIGAPLEEGGPIGVDPSGRTFTVLHEGRLRVIDATTFQKRGEPIGVMVTCSAISPDGEWLVTGGRDRIARVWRLSDGSPVGGAMEHPSVVRSVLFHPDGRRIVTAADDARLRVWDRPTAMPEGPVLSHEQPITQILCDPAGRQLFALGGGVTIWPLSQAPAPDAWEPETVLARQTALRLREDRSIVMASPTEWAQIPGTLSASTPSDLTEWHRRLADRWEFEGASDAARWHLDRILSRQPQDWRALIARSHLREQQGDSAGSDKDLLNAEKSAPPVVIRAIRFQKAFADYRKAESGGQPAAVIEPLNRLLSLDSDNLDFRVARGTALGLLQRWDEAADDLDRAVRGGPQPLRIYHALAIFHLWRDNKGAYRESVQRNLDGIRPDAPPTVLADLIWNCVLGPDSVTPNPPLSALAKKAVDALEGEARFAALNTLGAALYREGAYREAIAALDESSRAHGGSLPQDWAFLAMAHVRSGDKKAADSYLAKLRDWKPSGDPAAAWNDLEINLLRREAEEVLKSK